jgi:hypothetical protein
MLLMIVYKSAHSNDLRAAFTDDGSKWSGDKKISIAQSGINPKSNYTPGVAALGDALYIVYKGEGEDSYALHASWNQAFIWYGDTKISDMSGNINPQSNYCPNLAYYKNKLYTVYKAAKSNNLYAAWFDGAAWYGDKKISDLKGGISPESNYNPGMAVFGAKLYLVYKGANSTALYTVTFDGDKWSGDSKIENQAGKISPQSNYSPGAVQFKDKLYIVYKAADSTTLFSAWYDGSKWGGDTPIKDQGGDIDPKSSYCPNAAVFDDKLYIVYKGADSTKLYSAWYDGRKWGGDTPIKNHDDGINLESNYTPGISFFVGVPLE